MLNIALKAARNASQIFSKYHYQLDKLATRQKAQNDVVSEVDVLAEQEIIETIRQFYPDHAIIAEESGRKGESAIEWIIDPLDGSRNYLRGIPHYAVSIAVRIAGKIEHGLIFDPNNNEVFSASRGRGAFLNQRRLRVSECPQLAEAFLATGFPFRHREYAPTYFAMLTEIFAKTSGLRRAGAASLDLAYTAAGRFDGFWEYGLSIWDVAAGTLLVKEAGGLVSDFIGSDNYLSNGQIVVANPKLFRHLISIMQKHHSV